jgi:HEAT repeat protein
MSTAVAPTPPEVTYLLRLARSGVATERLGAIKGLSTIGNRHLAGGQTYETIVDALLAALTDPVPLVGARAMRGLSRMAALRAFDAVADRLTHPDYITRESATKALFHIDADRAAERLIDVLSNEHEPVRTAAAAGLSAVRVVNPRVLDTLAVTLTDPSATVRGAAMGSLRKLAGRTPDIAAIVLTIARNGLGGGANAYRREISLELLRQLKVPGDRERCLAALSDPAPVVRGRAVKHLAFVLPDKEIRTALKAMKSDPDDTVRQRVTEALSQDRLWVPSGRADRRGRSFRSYNP